MSIIKRQQPEAIASGSSMNITNLDDCMKIGAILAKSGFFKDIQNEQQAIAKIMRGWELGIPPVSALENINVIDGKTSISANLIASLIKRSKRYNYRVKELTDSTCTIIFMEAGESGGEYTFTMKEARNAGLGNDKTGNLSKYSAWSKTPKRMLFARCMTQGAGTYCPDILHGEVVSSEEMEDYSTVSDHEPEPITFNQSDVWQKFQAAIARAEDEQRITILEDAMYQRIRDGKVPNPNAACDAVVEEVAIARDRIKHKGYSLLPKYLDAITHVTDPEGAGGLRNQAMGDLSSEDLEQFNQALDARMSELNQELDMALAEG
ncbi:MAG: hypothetical protein AAGA75_17620 [Cyanobacteria bacterium P01_E01_bin.6]